MHKCCVSWPNAAVLHCCSELEVPNSVGQWGKLEAVATRWVLGRWVTCDTQVDASHGRGDVVLYSHSKSDLCGSQVL